MLVSSGILWPGRIFAAGYALRGVDVSSYQGRIDWPTPAGDDVTFNDVMSDFVGGHEELAGLSN
ncbi:hypothetical protein ACT3TZ_09905 [Brachybacterium sp. AOP25-B2-12]|uniref:hypothetical protein n=1 Tax=Brachybacterium sp. AOP25-B2-12 TaxID=3457710 RepID=UPI00403317EC